MNSAAEIIARPGSIGRSQARVRASLHLRFERKEPCLGTVLVDVMQEPPLRVIRAFTTDDHAALVHLHNVSGGVLGGDQLALSVSVGSGARAQLTTTGATRIYRSRPGELAASQANDCVIDENGLLEYVPDALIPFAGARFQQRTRIELAAGAGLFWWEIVSPGREARGERFAYDACDLETQIFVSGRPIAVENIQLRPRQRRMNSMARLGPYRYWITFYICHAGREARSWLLAEDHLREAIVPWCRPGEALWSVSTLPAHGLVLRGLARSGAQVLPALLAIWRSAKLFLFGQAPIVPRKVY